MRMRHEVEKKGDGTWQDRLGGGGGGTTGKKTKDKTPKK
jgi:hypothetical protein